MIIFQSQKETHFNLHMKGVRSTVVFTLTAQWTLGLGTQMEKKSLLIIIGLVMSSNLYYNRVPDPTAIAFDSLCVCMRPRSAAKEACNSDKCPTGKQLCKNVFKVGF